MLLPSFSPSAGSRLALWSESSSCFLLPPPSINFLNISSHLGVCFLADSKWCRWYQEWSKSLAEDGDLGLAHSPHSGWRTRYPEWWMGPGLFLGLRGSPPAVVPRRCHGSGIWKAGVEGETKCFKDGRDNRFRLTGGHALQRDNEDSGAV